MMFIASFNTVLGLVVVPFLILLPGTVGAYGNGLSSASMIAIMLLMLTWMVVGLFLLFRTAAANDPNRSVSEKPGTS